MQFVSLFIMIISLSLFSGATAAESQVASKTTEWRLLGNNSDMQHYSALSQVDRSNVARLGLKWYVDVPTKGGLLGNPLIADGVLYESGARGLIWAYDVRTTKLLWEFDPKVKFDGSLAAGLGGAGNRGVAVWNNYVYVGTPDCRLVAVDRSTGKSAWDVTICDTSKAYTISGAPRVGGGKVFIGNSNMDLGQSRGYVDAYDALTGKRLWRFYTIPGDPSKGYSTSAEADAAKTWDADALKTAAGGSAWDAITYDEKLNLLYFGTDSPKPINPEERGKKRNGELYTSSIVAVDADTGQHVWHYQTVPDDAWDYNAAMHIMIAELPIGGTSRRVVMTAPKNGFFYVLDAKSGRLLSANNYVPVTWTSGIDLKSGKPKVRSEALFYQHPGTRVRISPGAWGAHSWHAMSYDPELGLVYIPAMDVPTDYWLPVGGRTLEGGIKYDFEIGLTDPRVKGRPGRLIGWDPMRQQARWSVDLPVATNGGVLSTAGKVVFQGTGDGQFCAYDAATGKKLWSVFTGSSIQAAPSTIELDGQQLIFVAGGSGGFFAKLVSTFLSERATGPSRLFAFSLDGTMAIPAVTPDMPTLLPPRPRPTSAALIAQGRTLFAEKGCEICHGPDANRRPGQDIVPDLRRASAQTHDQFAAIVLGGLRRDKGMPVFAGQISATELDALQAFVLNQAWNAFDKQKPIAR